MNSGVCPYVHTHPHVHKHATAGNLAAVRILCAYAEEAGVLATLLAAADKKELTPLALAKDKEQPHVAKFLATVNSSK